MLSKLGYEILERDPVVLAEYNRVKSQRAIHSLDEFPYEHRWMLDEVVETLKYYCGHIFKYYLVSSWVEGSYLTESCSPEWRALKRKKRSWLDDRLKPEARKPEKMSDFDINIFTHDEKPTGFKAFFWTPSSIKVDIYPYKGERRVLINPDVEQVMSDLLSKGYNKV